MGTSFEARCEDCGYEASGSVGGGMRNHMFFCSWPALCLSCEEITTVNMKATPRECRNCASLDATPYLGEQASLSRHGPHKKRRIERMRDGSTYSLDPFDICWGDLKLNTLRRYSCPKCRNLSVAFAEGYMSWD